MKIVFILVGTEGRPKEINGDTIRYGNAPSSGTDQSTVLVAEYLSSIGFEVTIVLDKTDKKFCRGVNYTDFTYTGLINEDIDILITMLWFDGYDKIPFKVKKALIYWYHLAWVYCIDDIIKFCDLNNLKLALVNVSKWSQSQNRWSIDLSKTKVNHVIDKIIPNPIMVELIDDILKNTKIERKNKTSIFHAQYSRGGDVAKSAIKQLGWPEMYIFDYTNNSRGVDKITLFTKLLETDYFIFPSYSSNGCVYKDTFSCSIAEAIASGVIVLTYPLGAIPEYFEDGCVFLEFPNGTDMDRMMNERVTCDAEYMNYIENIKDSLNELENNIELKIEIRNKSINSIKNRFNINIVGEMWKDLINEI